MSLIGRIIDGKWASLYSGMNYIRGSFLPNRPDFADHNPATEEVVGRFPQSTSEEIRLAVSAARTAFRSWKSLSRVQRAEYFWKLANCIEHRVEEIARVISIETGKSMNESRAEVVEALHMTQYCFGKGREPNGDTVASELSERDSFVIRKPKGVVAVIAPWNFPFAIGGFWCAGPSLLEGNTVVFKPSELTPMVGQLTAELFDEAGFPPGVFNMIHGDGDVGAELVVSDVNHIAFTGSAEVGQLIRKHCAECFDKSCSCEMGSKSAVMVFENGDLPLAVSASLNSAFKLSGQRCVSASRLIVQRSILNEFKESFVAEASKIVVKDPCCYSDAALTYGPLISEDQMTRVEMFNAMVRGDSDATVLLDADAQGTLKTAIDMKGWFLRPFVYEVEWADKPYLKQEVFGPHVAIIPFDTVEDAIRIYNDTDFGLALGAITNDYRTMREIRNNCDAGMIYFNLGSIGAESHLPFTGVKKSGYGGSSAAGMFDSVVHKVAVSVNHGKEMNFPQGLK